MIVLPTWRAYYLVLQVVGAPYTELKSLLGTRLARPLRRA